MDDFIKRLRETFDLREDGLLVWRKPTSNRAKVGDVAGTWPGTPRHTIGFDGRRWTARSLAFAHRTGSLPAGFVDEATGEALPTKTDPSETVEQAAVRLVAYDAHTGVFRWAQRPSKGVRTGDVLGSKANNGYLRTKLAGREVLLHRLAWFMTHGAWPDGDIDHINGDKADNRIANLRVVDARTNTENQRRAMVTNRVGLLGVGRHGRNCYRATIKVDGKSIHLGSFKTPEEAHQRYVQAKRELHAGCTL